MEENKLPKELYHYTSLETFYNIVKGKELWFFDTLSNYDKNEYSLVDKKIREVFKKEYNYDCRERVKEIAVADYSLSLTSEEDSFFHFHKYANGNTGICICFVTDAFTSALNNIYHINNGNIIDIVPISYRNDRELERIITQEIEDDKKSLLILDEDRDNKEVLENLYKSIYSKYAKIIKSNNYKAENEYRFLYNDITSYLNIILDCIDGEGLIDEKRLDKLSSIKEQNDKILKYKEDFVCANGKIRKCCKINIEPIIDKKIISKIIIGSKCKNSVEDIKAFLRFNNFPIEKVVSSQINID